MSHSREVYIIIFIVKSTLKCPKGTEGWIIISSSARWSQAEGEDIVAITGG